MCTYLKVKEKTFKQWADYFYTVILKKYIRMDDLTTSYKAYKSKQSWTAINIDLEKGNQGLCGFHWQKENILINLIHTKPLILSHVTFSKWEVQTWPWGHWLDVSHVLNMSWLGTII